MRITSGSGRSRALAVAGVFVLASGLPVAAQARAQVSNPRAVAAAKRFLASLPPMAHPHVDPIPPGGPRAGQPSGTATERSGPVEAAAPGGTLTPRCEDSPSTGMQMLYAHPNDVTSRLPDLRSSLLDDAALATNKLQEDADANGAPKRIRFVCGITDVTIERASSEYSGNVYQTITEDLTALGYNASNRKYVVWWDGPPVSGACGVGNFYGDSSADPAVNQNNLNTGWAAIFRPDGTDFCGYVTVLHEIGHTLGAVQDTSPNSNGLGHCTDESDVMCYEEGGVPTRDVCPTLMFDCGGDDYFNSSPPPGNYLLTNWNLYSSSWLTEVGPTLTHGAVAIDDAGGNANGVADPGEAIGVTHTLRNDGDQTATGVSATLSSTTAGVSVTQANATYPDVGPGGTSTAASPYTATLPSNFVCGDDAEFRAAVVSAQGNFTVPFSVPVGARTSAASTGAVPIPDPGTVESSIAVPAGTPVIHDLNVRVNLAHTYVGDLDIDLISPRGTVLRMFDGANTQNGNDFTGTIFDDEAATPIASGVAPYSGRFRPRAGNPLDALDGEDPVGTWRLRVADAFGEDSGTLTSWSLDVSNCPNLVPATTAISATASPTTVKYGLATVVSGALRAGAIGLAKRLVTVQKRPAGAAGFTNVASVRTDAAGAFRVSHKPTKQTQYRAVFAGQPTYAAATSAAVTARVRPATTLSLSTTSLRLGRSVSFSGTVRPGHTGKQVRLERLVGSIWRLLKTVTLSSSSSFSGTFKPPSTGTYKLRTRFPVQDTDHLDGTSVTRTLGVS